MSEALEMETMTVTQGLIPPPQQQLAMTMMQN
jgi:hypothetical protein